MSFRQGATRYLNGRRPADPAARIAGAVPLIDRAHREGFVRRLQGLPGVQLLRATR